MPRSREVGRQLVTVAALGALLIVAVLAVTPVGPWILRSSAAPRSDAAAARYTCDLSSYGYTGSPVTFTTSADAKETATAFAQSGFSPVFSYNGPASFSSSTITLPASVAARLANLSKIAFAATIPVFGAPAASPEAKISGIIDDADLPTGPLTQLQVTGAFVTAFYSSPGIAWLEFPAPSLVFTPYRDDVPLPAFTCTAARGSVPPTEVTVTTAPAVAPSGSAAAASAAAASAAAPATTAASTAPAYECTSTRRTPTYRSPLPMTITTSGAATVGHLLTVTLSSPASGLAAPAPGLATGLRFAGVLRVTGAQPDEIILSRATADTDNPTFTVSGRFMLTRPGADTISFPRRFDYTVYLGGNSKAVFACTLTTSPARGALTVQVAP